MNLFKEKNIPILITVVPLFAIITLVVLFLFFFIKFQEYTLEKESKQIRRDFIAKNKVEINKEVNRAVDLIDAKFKNELDRMKKSAMNRVNSACKISEIMYLKYKDQRSENNIQDIIKDVLKVYSYSSSSGYYFIRSSDNKTIFKTDETKDTYISKSDFDTMVESKEGYINRNFLNPYNMYDDITYIKEFSTFKWFIGYSDFVEAMKANIKEDLTQLIGNIQLSSNGYLFVFEINKDNNVTMLINKNRELEGKSINTSLNDSEGKSFLAEHFKTLQKNGEVYVDYLFSKPESDYKQKKLSYFKIYKQLDWVIGAGFYLNDAEFLINQAKEKITKDTKENISTLIIGSVVFAIFVALISLIFSFRTRVIFKNYQENIRKKSEQLEEFSKTLEDKVAEQTSKIKEKSIQIYNASREDILTRLPNSIVFLEELKDTYGCMLIVLNIDHFDAINNTYGMLHGDKVLFLTAKKLQMLIPNDAKIYRLDSNEFAILVGGDDDRAKMIANKIDRYFDNHPVTYNQVDIKINFTFGASKNLNSDSISHAKIALKEGKMKGRKKFILYNDESAFAKQQKLNSIWTHKLKEAIAQDRIVPYFQPIVDNLTRKVVKYEVLVRIIEDNKVISPFNFMCAARTTRFLNTITQSIIKKSFIYFRDKNVDFSINLTEDDLRSDDLSEFLLQNARTYQIKPKRVTLEILENITLSGNKVMTDKINELKELGFIIAIDDFGSESSNYSRLTEINANVIKIDGMYIKNIATNPKDLKIVKSIVYLAKALGAETIAEYVHDETVYKIVTRLGIDYSQGFYFSEPQAKIGPSVL